MSVRSEALCKTDAIIDRIMNYPIDVVVEKYIDKYGIDEEVARQHERELKRYLAMCILNPSAHYGMKGQIDEIWHTFILFTREYATFCKEVAGRFMHHSPTTRSERKKQLAGEVRNTYQDMLADYPLFWGEVPPAVWPQEKRLTLVANECQSCSGNESDCDNGSGSADPGNDCTNG